MDEVQFFKKTKKMLQLEFCSPSVGSVPTNSSPSKTIPATTSRVVVAINLPRSPVSLITNAGL